MREAKERHEIWQKQREEELQLSKSDHRHEMRIKRRIAMEEARIQARDWCVHFE